MEASREEFARKVHVDFSDENITKCRCGQCPVQEESRCALDKTQAMSQMAQTIEEMPGLDDPPAPEDVPGVYCSTGTATCSDLDYSRNCICASCDVWQEHGLSAWKYCQTGSADIMG